MVEALVWAADQCGLATPPPAPVAYHLSMAVRQSRPVVNVLTNGSDPDDDDDGNRSESKQITVEVERTAGDSDELIATLEPYTLAFQSMLLEMDEDDWWQGINRTSRDDLDVSVGKERYSGRTYQNENVFLQIGSVEVTLTYTQT